MSPETVREAVRCARFYYSDAAAHKMERAGTFALMLRAVLDHEGERTDDYYELLRTLVLVTDAALIELDDATNSHVPRAFTNG